MPIIPLKQSATIEKMGERNDYGEAEVIETFSLICRADEKTQVVKNQVGKEVVSTVELLFDRMANIGYDDTVTFTNELGVTISRQPLSIEPIRMINGKPILTAVYL